MEREFEQLNCPVEDISAYVDGELDPASELQIEMHLAGCRVCSFELNEQKHFLRELDSGLRVDNDLELPANFTKLIVANAESTVTGLRRPGERFNALFICAALFIVSLFALGSDSERVVTWAFNVFDQTAIVAGFFGHIVYSLFLGVVIILRSMAAQAGPETLSVAALGSIFVLLLAAVSKRALQVRRA